jgi:hypothetical protein
VEVDAVRTYQIGHFYRFEHDIVPGSIAYVFTKYHPEKKQSNALWVPRGTTCQIRDGAPMSDEVVEVPEAEVTDEMWIAIGRAGLAGLMAKEDEII